MMCVPLGKIKAMKITFSVLALKTLQNSLCNRGKYTHLILATRMPSLEYRQHYG